MPNSLLLGHVANVALGIFLLGFACLAAYMPRPGAVRGWLAAYLALVGLNYAADGTAYVLDIKDHSSLVGTIIAWTNWLDPPALLLFAIAATGRRLRATGIAAAFLPSLVGVSPFFASWFLGTTLPPGWPWPPLLALTIAAGYSASLAILLQHCVTRTEPEERAAWSSLVTAFAIVCIPRLALAPVDLGLLAGGPVGRASTRSWVIEAALAVALLLFAAFTKIATPRPAPPHLRPLVLGTVGILAVIELEWLLRFVPFLQQGSFSLLYAFRWFLVLAVVCAGLRRHEVLGLPTAVAPFFRRTLYATFAVASAAQASAFLASLPGATTVGAILGACVMVGLVALAFVAIRRSMARPAGELEWRRAALYRAHVTLGASVRERARLRRLLGMTDQEALSVERAIQAEQALPQRALPQEIGIGTLLGRYQVDRVVGVGAFGRVYGAFDAVAGERVVIKELLPQWRDDPDALRRFRLEAQTLLRLRHPNLVAFRSIERLAHGHALVLEDVEGEALAARLARGRMAHPEARRLAADLLSALDELHLHGFLHRDIKPANILLRPNGRAVLSDFGAATTRGAPTRPAQGHPRTAGYASPEQEAGHPLTFASDIYSVAAVLWRALSGHESPRGDVPEPWRATLSSALDPIAANRFQTARQFAKALDLRIQPTRPGDGGVALPPSRSTRPRDEPAPA